MQKNSRPTVALLEPATLTGLLEATGQTIQSLAARIVQPGGVPLHRTALSAIINRGIWPATTSQQRIEQQLVAALVDFGATPLDAHEAVTALTDAPAVATAIAPASSKTRPAPPLLLPRKEMLNESTRTHFRLFRDPFVDEINEADDIFQSPDIRYVFTAMYQTARTGGFLAVIGESGAGKTTLRRMLEDKIARGKEPITIIKPRAIDKARLTASMICDAIVGDMSKETPKRTVEAKARQIERLLSGSANANGKHVVLIEEAHDLTIKSLKELKRFWELESGFRKLLSIILVGQPELHNNLNVRINWEAREVINRCEIATLRPLDTHLEAYLAHKFARRGDIKLDAVFEKSAYDAMRAKLTVRTQGMSVPTSYVHPLMVNNVATRAMNLAAELGMPKVTADVVSKV